VNTLKDASALKKAMGYHIAPSWLNYSLGANCT